MSEPRSRSAMKCPSCRAEVARGIRTYPFCSPRCRDVDLGCWLREEFRIPEGAGDQSAPVPSSDDER